MSTQDDKRWYAAVLVESDERVLAISKHDDVDRAIFVAAHWLENKVRRTQVLRNPGGVVVWDSKYQINQENNMSNVREIIAHPPKPDELIQDMEIGETGYTVPWAYDIKTGILKTDYLILDDRGDAASLWVECVGVNEYVIGFTHIRRMT